MLMALKQLYRGKLSEEEIDGFEKEFHRAGEGSSYFPISWQEARKEVQNLVTVLWMAVARILDRTPGL